MSPYLLCENLQTRPIFIDFASIILKKLKLIQYYAIWCLIVIKIHRCCYVHTVFVFIIIGPSCYKTTEKRTKDKLHFEQKGPIQNKTIYWYVCSVNVNFKITFVNTHLKTFGRVGARVHEC